MRVLKSAAGLAAAIMVSVGSVSVCASGKYTFICDVNGDNVIGTKDLAVMRDYMLGNTEFDKDQYTAADINHDGIVDVFDMVQMRKKTAEAVKGKVPVGSWMTDSGEIKYYYFDKNGTGNCISENTGKGLGYTFVQSGNRIDFTIGSAQTKNYADISWIDDKHCVLLWRSGNVEKLTYYGEKMINYSSLPPGRWVTSGGYGNRIFNFNGVHGSFSGNNGTDYGTFVFSLDGDNFGITVNENGLRTTAKLTKTDQWHFTLTWASGKTEKFTRQEISVKDGITYINGILIANKSYGLPSTYDPGALTSETLAAFNEMKAAAYNSNRYELKIVSGYRSYSYQSTLYHGYAARDGYAKADTYSARPGFSEHQTGLALDINNASGWFDNTPEAKWIADNCWKYGFILRYPKGKENITGYMYESWHVRYLGKDLAKRVYDSGLTLEEYLAIDSVYK